MSNTQGSSRVLAATLTSRLARSARGCWPHGPENAARGCVDPSAASEREGGPSAAEAKFLSRALWFAAAAQRCSARGGGFNQPLVRPLSRKSWISVINSSGSQVHMWAGGSVCWDFTVLSFHPSRSAIGFYRFHVSHAHRGSPGPTGPGATGGASRGVEPSLEKHLSGSHYQPSSHLPHGPVMT